MRKSLLIALLLAPLIADARIIAETYNKNGGKIVITDEVCRDARYKLAYAMSAGISTLLGCWTSDEDFIHIQWYDGDLRSYPYEGWVVKNQKPNT
jgi:hypothetical protein